MIKLFDRFSTIPLVCDTDSDEAILLALADLQRNLRDLSGQQSGFAIQHTDTASAIRVATDPSIGGNEAYRVCVTNTEIAVTGSDTLGTVYGIYALATNCLGILPFYRLTDLFPEVREELYLEPQTLTSPKRAIRFRGWFLNDEDLLTELCYSGGRRDIDYPFYQDVIDVDVLDMVLETALRMEINLLIPASFLNIDNPDEENWCVR